MSDVVDRFVRYIKIDTQSNPDSTSFPSTSKQFNLAKILYDELSSLGLKDLSLDENGYVMATLPSNSTRNVPSIGWIAHMDTSPDMSGEGVNPKFTQKYDGGDIVLNTEKKILLSPSDFPEMRNYIGQTLITTDGTTLLGADDKAGVAAIMAAVSHLIRHPEIEHGPLKIGFTPDEEVGQGAERFDVKKFGADFAYTIDGGEVGELEYENFNAASAKILIKGRGVHPGTAKNKMINAINIAMDIAGALPAHMKPEFTENNEGFFHLMRFDGTIEEASLQYIIREHDKDKFEWQKGLIQRIVQNTNYKYGPGTAHLELKDQYYNMKEKILPVMHIIETAREAIEAVGLTPRIIPVRGGTDGARLSYMGLPCPNIFTGGHNAHGRFEYLPVESLEKAEEVILKIIELYTDRSEKN